MPERRKPSVTPPASRDERQQLVRKVRKEAADLRLQLRLAEAEERYLRLYNDVFDEDESEPFLEESESDSDSGDLR